MAEIRPRALACLRDGRVAIKRAEGGRIIAAVRSSRNPDVVYIVDRYPSLEAAWFCTCRADGGCPHIAAVQLVTGHKSAAAKVTT